MASQGAWIMGAAAREATSDVQDAVTAVLLMADPNGADKGGMQMSPSGNTNYAQGSGATDSAAAFGATAWLINKGLGTMYPIVEGGRYDSIAEKVLHLCGPGDGVCDAVTGNILSGHIHSYAYRGKDVFSNTDDGRENRRLFEEIFGKRDLTFPIDGAEWRSDWSVWQDSRVREWFVERS